MYTYRYIFVQYYICTHIAKYDILLHSGKGGFYMVATEAHKKAVKEYKAKKIKRVPLDMQLSDYEALKGIAEQTGETINGYIKRAIAERMDRETGR